MPRPPTRKKGAYTRAEIQRRYRQRKKRERVDPRTAAKQHRRAERESALAYRTIEASQRLRTKLYGVILADPPWRHEPYSRETGLDRAADNHYPTMTLDDIKALPVPAAEDAVLFLWTPVAQLANALDVLRAWRFAYKSAHGWAKPKAGTGYWVRDNLELLLIATRGQPVAPAPGQQMPSLVEAPQSDHSAKPAAFAEHIERLYPNTPRLEMFARGAPRPGWASWGNEAA